MHSNHSYIRKRQFSLTSQQHFLMLRQSERTLQSTESRQDGLFFERSKAFCFTLTSQTLRQNHFPNQTRPQTTRLPHLKWPWPSATFLCSKRDILITLQNVRQMDRYLKNVLTGLSYFKPSFLVQHPFSVSCLNESRCKRVQTNPILKVCFHFSGK